MMGVFFDTIILCTCTAVVILLSGFTGMDGENNGIQITQAAMQHHIGFYGGHFVAIALTLFAFTSVVANFAYAQSNLRVFGMDNRIGNTAYIVAYLAMVYWGSSATLTQVLAAADMSLGLMTVVNIVALFLLSPTIIAVSKHYHEQIKTSNKPVKFKRQDCAIQGQIENHEWN